MGNAVHESLARCGRSSQRTKRKRRDMKMKIIKNNDEEDKVEVERKIVELQKIVPGGESLGVDKLFEETAGYILDLQCQIKAMRVLASFVEGLEKEKGKFGG